VLDRVPFVFNDDRITFIQWKEELAERLGIDPKAMVLTGSASCGFSLNPYKNYREYNDQSDIDIALVSELHFDIAWKTLRNLGTKRLDLTPKQKSKS
jgi:predicted nucleotidyltransferase